MLARSRIGAGVTDVELPPSERDAMQQARGYTHEYTEWTGTESLRMRAVR